jgi:hypothetical protein
MLKITTYKIIFVLVLHGCATYFLALRESHQVSRTIFRHKRNEVGILGFAKRGTSRLYMSLSIVKMVKSRTIDVNPVGRQEIQNSGKDASW